jgi:subtilisin family serine protease
VLTPDQSAPPCTERRYGYMQGTSMASPHTAGGLALLASTHPGAGPSGLRDLLFSEATAHPCPAIFDPDGTGLFRATCEGGPSTENHRSAPGGRTPGALRCYPSCGARSPSGQIARAYGHR